MKYWTTMVLATVILYTTSAQGAAPMKACGELRPMPQQSMPEETCQAFIVGAAYGFDYAMRRHDYEPIFCLTPQASDPSHLFNTALPDLRAFAQENPDMPVVVGVIAGMMDAFPCGDGAPDASFTSIPMGNVLAWCQQALEADTEAEGCASYLFGASQALTLSSGKRGADRWLCPPQRGVPSKAIITLMVEDAIEDAEIQKLDAIDAIAQGMQRRYPCGSRAHKQ